MLPIIKDPKDIAECLQRVSFILDTLREMGIDVNTVNIGLDQPEALIMIYEAGKLFIWLEERYRQKD